MVIETPEQAKELIQGWMSDRNFFDPNLNAVPTPEKFHFIIVGKHQNGTPFSVLQPKELKDTIIVASNVSLGNEHFEMFSALSTEERDILLWDLQRDIIFASPAYSFNPEYEKDGTFKGIQFIKEIAYDELTRGKLGDSVFDVTKCVLWVIWTFRRRFGPSKV